MKIKRMHICTLITIKYLSKFIKLRVWTINGYQKKPIKQCNEPQHNRNKKKQIFHNKPDMIYNAAVSSISLIN